MLNLVPCSLIIYLEVFTDKGLVSSWATSNDASPQRITLLSFFHFAGLYESLEQELSLITDPSGKVAPAVWPIPVSIIRGVSWSNAVFASLFFSLKIYIPPATRMTAAARLMMALSNWGCFSFSPVFFLNLSHSLCVSALVSGDLYRADIDASFIERRYSLFSSLSWAQLYTVEASSSVKAPSRRLGNGCSQFIQVRHLQSLSNRTMLVVTKPCRICGTNSWFLLLLVLKMFISVCRTN